MPSPSSLAPLFQSFDFSYPVGLLFYDRSGALARQLQQMIPGLELKSADTDQRELFSQQEGIELFYGIRVSRIQTLSPTQAAFPALAGDFLQKVAEALEINQLKTFHFRHVLGKPCRTLEEAQALMEPVLPEETKAKLRSADQPFQIRAMQFEFFVDNFAAEGRVALMDLVPHEQFELEGVLPGAQLPHITFHLDMRGLVPIDVAALDAKAFIDNVREKHTKEILAKIAPHLDKA